LEGLATTVQLADRCHAGAVDRHVLHRDKRNLEGAGGRWSLMKIERCRSRCPTWFESALYTKTATTDFETPLLQQVWCKIPMTTAGSPCTVVRLPTPQSSSLLPFRERPDTMCNSCSISTFMGPK
jgi:hypothetical protein